VAHDNAVRSILFAKQPDWTANLPAEGTRTNRPFTIPIFPVWRKMVWERD